MTKVVPSFLWFASRKWYFSCTFSIHLILPYIFYLFICGNKQRSFISIRSNNGRWYVKGLVSGSYTQQFYSKANNDTHSICVRMKVSYGDFSIPSTMELKKDNEQYIPIDGSTSYCSNVESIGFKINWSSSNPDIVKVKNGYISALAEGTAVITANLDGKYIHTCEVTVTGPPKKNVELVAPDNITIYTGEAITAKELGIYGVIDGEKYYYDSSNQDELDDLPNFEFDFEDIEIASECVYFKHGYTDEDEEYLPSYITGYKKGNTVLNIRFYVYDWDANVCYDDTKTVNVTVKYTSKFKGCAYISSIKRSTFSIPYTNYSNKTMQIYSSGAKSIDREYKKFDCTLKLNKGSYVSIKPGQTKTIKFVVKKGKPWQDPYDEIVYCTCKFNNKKYQLKIDDRTCYYKSGGKWKCFEY